MDKPSRYSETDGIGVIYGLFDPRDPALPKYVGQTITKLKKRLKDHIQFAGKNPEKPLSKWIFELRGCGLKPLMCVIEEVKVEHIDERERHWIMAYRPMKCLTNIADGATMIGQKPTFPDSAMEAFLKNRLLSLDIIRKPVVNENGERFESITAACKSLGIKRTYRFGQAMKRDGVYRGQVWKYAEKASEK